MFESEKQSPENLDEKSRFLAAVEKGIESAQRGDFIEQEEMDARLEAWFKV